MGAAIVNDLSPVVAEDFFRGGVNIIALLDRRLYLVFCLYEGAISCGEKREVRHFVGENNH